MIKEQLRRVMEERGESVATLAVKANVSDGTLYRILAGGGCQVETLRALALALNVDGAVLLDEVPVMNRTEE